MKGRSTTLQLLNVLNDWTQSMENKNSTDCVYMDYQKAFDKVPHGRLLAKLEAYNLSSEVINWIKEYLTLWCSRAIQVDSPPPLLPPLLPAIRVDTIIHNYCLSTPP